MPHLDSLFASTNIDFVSFDNYLPLSDWTTSNEGFDQVYWQTAAPTSWPPSSPAFNGLGLTGAPTIYSKPYLKANVEGGEKFNWFYDDSINGGAELDPLGSGLYVSQPQGDRASQSRQPYFANQQLLANKQVRWWWNNVHQAIYDTGAGFVPQGPTTQWVANSKPILFLEYGIPAVDRGTNQPNLFYRRPRSRAGHRSGRSGTVRRIRGSIPDVTTRSPASPCKRSTSIGTPTRRRTTRRSAASSCCNGRSAASGTGTRGRSRLSPLESTVWGDAADWPYGDWQNGRGPVLPPMAPSADPMPGNYATFPTLATLGWSVQIRPRFSTDLMRHVSGRETRRAARAHALYEIELTFELLRAVPAFLELQTIAGFFLDQGGEDAVFGSPRQASARP